jgi:hypothetical protein
LFNIGIIHWPQISYRRHTLYCISVQYMHNNDTSLDQGVPFPRKSLVALVKISLGRLLPRRFVPELLYLIFVKSRSLDTHFLQFLGKLSSILSNFPNNMQVGGRSKKLSQTPRGKTFGDQSSMGPIVQGTNNSRTNSSGKHVNAPITSHKCMNVLVNVNILNS